MSFMSNVCGSDLHMLLKQILLCIRTFLIHNLCVISKDCNRFQLQVKSSLPLEVKERINFLMREVSLVESAGMISQRAC